MTELFQYPNCPDTVKAAGAYLLKQINASSGQILLLLSGGSSLNAVRETFKVIKPEVVNRIDLAQIDERFVDIDDQDSNWRVIKDVTGDSFAHFDKKVSIRESVCWPAPIT
jgi:6-phosphogluconolactonase/glucosamine-6-phosphate isomerase/deaminase